MVYVANTFESWEEFKPIMQSFLETKYEFLFVPWDNSISPEQLDISSIKFPQVDVIQFFSMKPWERGELGVREIHWNISDFIARSKIIFYIFQMLSKFEALPVSKLTIRYKLMRARRSAIREISKGFAEFGQVIPHYIEPRKSTIFLSRSFVEALLEFNAQSELSMVRAIFALARTANFSCIRISGF